MKTRRIAVVAPSFTHRSAGIFMMHFLMHQLREIGFDAFWVPQNRTEVMNPMFNTPHIRMSGVHIDEIRNEWITIYPEGIFQNPFNAKHVVRYLLNREDAFSPRGMGAAPEDYLLTYARLFHPNAPVLYYPIFDSDMVIRSGRLTGEEPRTLDAFYIGKGFAYGECPPIARAVEITRNWPENKLALSNLLQTVRVFYSYDWVTSTTLDALLMGCEVRLIGQSGHLGADELLQSSGMPNVWERTSEGGIFMRRESRPKFLRAIQEYRAAFNSTLLDTFRQIMEHFSKS